MNYQTLIFAFLLLNTPLFAQKKNVTYGSLDINNGLLFVPNTMKPYSGTAKETYSDGKKRLHVPIKDGKVNGKVTEWAKNGEKASETTYQMGIQNGKETQWYASGQKKLDINYVNGEAQGVCTEWFKNGAKKSEGTFVNGKEDGLHQWWYNNGAKDQVVNYKNGLADGTVRHWRQNGQLKLENEYKNGLQHGKSTEWYNSNQMIMTGQYVEGKENGVFKYWSKKGLLLGVQTFDHGRLIKDLNYRSGNVRTATGFVQVFNEKESFFKVNIEGEEVIPMESKEEIIYVVDDQYLQLFNTPVSRFQEAPAAATSKEELLKRYMDYEIQYIKKQTETDIEVQSELLKTNSGLTYLYWHFSSPSKKNQKQSTRLVVEEHYISLLCNQQVLNLYGLTTEKESASKSKQLLQKIVDQVSIEKDRIDLNAVFKP